MCVFCFCWLSFCRRLKLGKLREYLVHSGRQRLYVVVAVIMNEYLTRLWQRRRRCRHCQLCTFVVMEPIRYDKKCHCFCRPMWAKNFDIWAKGFDRVSKFFDVSETEEVRNKTPLYQAYESTRGPWTWVFQKIKNKKIQQLFIFASQGRMSHALHNIICQFNYVE